MFVVVEVRTYVLQPLPELQLVCDVGIQLFLILRSSLFVSSSYVHTVYVSPLVPPPRKGNIADHMLGLMERYASNLEEAIEEQTLVLAKEKARTEALVYRLLPK